MRDTPSSVMIFAAGFGKRMGPLTADRPKPMVSVDGRPLIDHALELVDDFGLLTIVMNLHYRPEMLREHLCGRDIAFSLEEPDLLETGGGLRAALPMLGPSPIFTMNSDAAWSGENPLSVLARHWQPEKMDALLLCIPTGRAVGHKGHGDFVLGKDGVAERGKGVVYTGVQILKTDGLRRIDERIFSLNLLWNDMIAEGRLFGVEYPGRWCDVGSPEGIALAEAMLGKGDV